MTQPRSLVLTSESILGRCLRCDRPVQPHGLLGVSESLSPYRESTFSEAERLFSRRNGDSEFGKHLGFSGDEKRAKSLLLKRGRGGEVSDIVV